MRIIINTLVLTLVVSSCEKNQVNSKESLNIEKKDQVIEQVMKYHVGRSPALSYLKEGHLQEITKS